MLIDLLSFSSSAAGSASEPDVFENWIIPGFTGGSVVAATGYVFLRGTLATLKGYSDLIVHYKNREQDLLAENASLARMNEDYRTTLHEANTHMEACRKDNEIANRRIETMSLKIVDLEGEIRLMSSQLHGKEALD